MRVTGTVLGVSNREWKNKAGQTMVDHVAVVWDEDEYRLSKPLEFLLDPEQYKTLTAHIQKDPSIKPMVDLGILDFRESKFDGAIRVKGHLRILPGKKL